ncbi:hypothetical protein B0H13DRAFT_767436 [Mycena leptocephala]|nr:hypothetical protein B0H13DRAFT_767436 [Mycena leptocephala]
MPSDSAFSGITFASATILLYHALQRKYTAQRQRAWIITALSSAVMTICSVPFLLDLALSRGDVSALRPRSQHAALVCRAFQGFLLGDLFVGWRYYRSSITICWGWIHHSAYIVLLYYLVQRQWAHIFCVCAVMELPTLQLSLSFLHPRFRHDWLFCASFLATRIFFHLFLLHAFCSPLGLSAVQGSYLPAIFLALALPGHAMWFLQSVRGAIRRGRKQALIVSICLVDKHSDQSALDQTLVCAALVSLDNSSLAWKPGNRVDVVLSP